jgi:hypothetical protein
VVTYSPDGWDFGGAPPGPRSEPADAEAEAEAIGFGAATSPFSTNLEGDRSQVGRPAAQSGRFDQFGGTPSSGGQAGSARSAPLNWLFAAGFAAGLAVLLGTMASFRPSVAIIGWLLGGFCAIGLVTAFTVKDAELRTDPWYLERETGRWLRLLVLMVAIAGVVINAWQFADYVSRGRVF